MSDHPSSSSRRDLAAGRRPGREWVRILGSSVLTVAAMWQGHNALIRFGVRNPTPYLLLLLFSVILLRLLVPARWGEQDAPGDEPVLQRWVRMPSGWTPERLVNVVLVAEQRHLPTEEIVTALMAAGFSEDDGHLAIARTMGGLVRARSGSPRNAPSRWKDPIAWTSYRRGLRDPELVASLVPLASPVGEPNERTL